MRAMTRRTALRWLSASVALGAFASMDRVPRISAATGATVYDLGANPHTLADISAAPDGSIWFLDEATDEIGRITVNGIVARYSLPTRPADIAQNTGQRISRLLAAPDGAVWFTRSTARKVGRRSPDGVIAEYALAEDLRVPYLVPNAFAVGPDSSFWYASGASKMLVRITPNGAIRSLSVKDTPLAITAGPDGNMWFTMLSRLNDGTETPNPTLGVVTPEGGVSYAPFTAGYPITGEIIYGPGDTFWILQPSLHRIGLHNSGTGISRVTLAGVEKSVSLFSLFMRDIVAGADGSAWVHVLHSTGESERIVRVTPAGEVTEYLPPDDTLFLLAAIRASPDGDILFHQTHEKEKWSRIGRLDPTRAIPLPPRT